MITKEYYMNGAVLSDETIVIKNIEDLNFIMPKLFSSIKIDSIVSFTDNNNGVYLASKYSNELFKKNLTASPKSVELVSNKYLTRNYLDSINLRNVNYIESTDEKEVIEFFKQIKAPIILKPVDGQGSAQVKKVTTIHDIIDYFHTNPSIKVIAEELLIGKEFSVESIIINKKIYMLGITEKFIIGENNCGHNQFVEKGHVFPATLDLDNKNSIYDYLTKFLENLDINNSLVHSEIILTTNGPVLVESHLRAGGDAIPNLIENSTGYDIFNLFLKSLFEDFTLNIDYKNKSAIGFLIPNVGIISSYNKLDSIQENKNLKEIDITLSIGQKVNPIANSHDRTYGYIISVDKENPMSIIDKIFKDIDVKTSI